jgi:hypothetical protein
VYSPTKRNPKSITTIYLARYRHRKC